MKISLIVTDASPLITLATAGALDTLLMFGVRLIIPDMIEFEVVRHLDKPGARRILSWIADHKAQGVVIGETQEYKEFRILIEHDPKIKIRNRGELAAGEILTWPLAFFLGGTSPG